MPAISQTRYIITGNQKLRRGDRVVHFREELPEGATTLDPLPDPAPGMPAMMDDDGPMIGSAVGPREERIITTEANAHSRGVIVKVTRSYVVEAP